MDSFSRDISTIVQDAHRSDKRVLMPIATNTYIRYMYTEHSAVADQLAFDSEEANLAHIARHTVTIEEAEQAFNNHPMDIRVEVVDGEERYTAVGHTNQLRVHVLAWTMRGETTRPITAFDASERLAKRYLAERGF